MSSSTTRSSRRVPLLAVAVGVVVVAAVVAVVVAMISPAPEASAALETSEVTVSGEALPVMEAGAPDPAVGQPAPALTGNAPNSTVVEVEPGSGPVILAFMAHWCPHCQDELPVLSDWMAAGGDEGVDVIAVSTAVDPARPNYPPSTWFEREDFSGPVLVDDEQGSAAQAYGLPAFPYFVFVDGDGNVAARAVGELTPEQLDAASEELRTG